jgi:hypothetical protein
MSWSSPVEEIAELRQRLAEQDATIAWLRDLLIVRGSDHVTCRVCGSLIEWHGTERVEIRGHSATCPVPAALAEQPSRKESP